MVEGLYNRGEFSAFGNGMYLSSDSPGDNNLGLFFFTRNPKDGQSDVRMTIRENGRVGIGTTNPRRNLEVSGGIQATQLCLPQAFIGFRHRDVVCFNYVCPTSEGYFALSVEPCQAWWSERG